VRVNESVMKQDEPGFTGQDLGLLIRIAERDQEALTALYDLRGGLLFALCLRILKDRMAAEEALEDVFWELWAKSDRFDPDRGTPINYLLNLTQSRAIDKLRGRAKLQRMELATDRDAAVMNSPSTPAYRTPQATPAEMAVDSERRNTVRSAVDGLNPEQRQAVELAFFDGLTHTEIADKLAIPLGTIKTRIRQGLVHLKKALAVQFGHVTPGSQRDDS
jgi:RNA polymerase sigma-70 factor (ECF subfamily)